MLCSATFANCGGAVRHCSDQSFDVFHKYSLGGDTMTPSRLYARLCHALLVYIILYVSKNEYRINKMAGFARRSQLMLTGMHWHYGLEILF